MNISLRVCELDISRDRIVVAIEADGQIYREERSWIAEAADSDEFLAVLDIQAMLRDIFRSISL